MAAPLIKSWHLSEDPFARITDSRWDNRSGALSQLYHNTFAPLQLLEYVCGVVIYGMLTARIVVLIFLLLRLHGCVGNDEVFERLRVGGKNRNSPGGGIKGGREKISLYFADAQEEETKFELLLKSRRTSVSSEQANTIFFGITIRQTESESRRIRKVWESFFLFSFAVFISGSTLNLSLFPWAKRNV